MDILAIAGGSHSGEGLFWCCCTFPLLSLVLCLAGVAVVRNSVPAAAFSFLLAGLPFLLLLGEVAGYQPSDDWEEMEDQASGRSALVFYAWLVGITGLSLIWVAGRRLYRRGRTHAEPPATSSPPAPGGPGQ